MQDPVEAMDSMGPGEAAGIAALHSAGRPLGPTLNLSGDPAAIFSHSISRSGNVVMVVWTEDTIGGAEIFFRRGSGKSFDDKVSLGASDPGRHFSRVLAHGQNAYVVWLGPSGVRFRASHDRGKSFGPEIPLSDPATGGRTFLTAAGDNVYVAWVGGEDGQLFFRASHDEGESFDPQQLIGAVGQAALAAAGNRVYLAWDDTTDEPSESDIFFRRSKDEGRSFESTQFLSDDPNLASRSPALAAVGDRLFAVWADCDVETERECEIKFRRSTDGGDDFSRERNLSKNEDSNARSPQVAVAGPRVNVAWVQFALVPEGTTGVFFRRSTDSGRAFDGKLKLSPSPTSFSSSLAADGSRAHVVWEEDGEVFGRTVKKGRPGPLVNVSDNAGASFSGLVAADDGEIDIAWIDGPFRNWEVLYRHGEDVIRD